MYSLIDSAAWAHLRTMARIFAEAQQARKRLNNQVGLTKADGTPRKDSDRKPGFMQRDGLLELAEKSENVAKSALSDAWRRAVLGDNPDSPFRRLVEDTPGLKWFSMSRLLGETGHPLVAVPKHWEPDPTGKKKRILVAEAPYVRTQRVWLAYCGHGDPDRRHRSGMSQADLFGCGNTRAKTAAWLIAKTGFQSATGKMTKDGKMRRAWPWRSTWDDYHARAEEAHPDWTPKRLQMASNRVMTKAVLVAVYRAAWDDVLWRRDLEAAA